MDLSRFRTGVGVALIGALVSGCGIFGGGERAPVETRPASEIVDEIQENRRPNRSRTSLFDFFRNRNDAGQIGAVNKYIWNAALETLDFLPVESVDPFTGVITTGYGTPPGGGRAYRATILVNDPALDARSLNIALMTRSGPASAATVRAVEDAILTRARQLRQQDSRF
ncbi:DUF3576 domain-containing protein [Marivita sp.]|uniref:DUF3576 domain-containing protein n=1 Tax=Marivita sp. TaxID=2003365 RepID=UPI0025C236F4|nr:DUF3576 domain-containing protein [Marivita sp.]